MARVPFTFVGLICPVFTPFHDDKEQTVNYDAIGKYAKYLSDNGITAIAVNSITGEGHSMSTAERKLILETWMRYTQQYNMICIAHIGGTSIADVRDLARHAEMLSVDAVICGPDWFYRPKRVNALVLYLKDIGQYCKSRPLIYYHCPRYFKHNLPMVALCDLAERDITNFAGLMYVDHDLDAAIATFKNDRAVILSFDNIIVDALTRGFRAVSTPCMNIWPELIDEIYTSFCDNRIEQARTGQSHLTDLVDDYRAEHSDSMSTWNLYIKSHFNAKLSDLEQDFNVGPNRNPAFPAN